MRLCTLLAAAALLCAWDAMGAAPERASLFDPAQLPMVRGVLMHYTLIPRSAADGFFLEDGTQVLVVPTHSGELLDAVRPGDFVTVYGLRAAGLPLVMALALVNEKTRSSVVLGDVPLLLALGRPPDHPGGTGHGAPTALRSGAGERGGESSARPIHGTVRAPIYGPRGDLNGALLTDGTVLRFASSEGARVADLLGAGKTLWAQGSMMANPNGKLLVVERIGASADSMVPLAAWDGPQ